MKLRGICLKQDSVSLCHRKTVNLCISYELDFKWSKNLNIGLALSYCLFGAVKLTKNSDPDICKYSSCGICFNSRSEFLWTDKSMGKMSLFLESIIVFLCLLMVEIKIFWLLRKDQEGR